MRPTVTVILDLGYGEQLRESVEVPESLIRRAYSPVDHYDGRSHPFAKIFCTPESEMRTVAQVRKDLASALGKELGRLIEKTMAARDTLMGYPIERTETPAPRTVVGRIRGGVPECDHVWMDVPSNVVGWPGDVMCEKCCAAGMRDRVA